MAGNMKEIKERIGSVKNTNQITRAMNIIFINKIQKISRINFKFERICTYY